MKDVWGLSEHSVTGKEVEMVAASVPSNYIRVSNAERVDFELHDVVIDANGANLTPDLLDWAIYRANGGEADYWDSDAILEGRALGGHAAGMSSENHLQRYKHLGGVVTEADNKQHAHNGMAWKLIDAGERSTRFWFALSGKRSVIINLAP